MRYLAAALPLSVSALIALGASSAAPALQSARRSQPRSAAPSARPPRSSPSARPGLTVGRDGTLLLQGRPYRGIGVNYFDAFARVLRDPRDTSYRQGFRELARRGIPFVRFMAGGYWPSENRLYLRDRTRFFRLMDAFVRAAEEERIGLIPSLFWHAPTAPDMVGEPVDQWGTPGSKTQAYMRRYVRDLVIRYRKSPALWGWEFGNEYSLSADLPNAAEHRPPVVPDLGTPSSRSARDELSSAIVRAAYQSFAREVRRWDPWRVIVSGDAFPRPSAWHQRAAKSWEQDTEAQYAEMLGYLTPDPMNAISVHLYDTEEQRFGRVCKAEDLLRVSLTAARRMRKPLFVGEFGASDEKGPQEARRRFSDLLSAVEREGVPLAALWVYDYGGQDGAWNVTAANSRAYQLDAIAEANRRLRQRAQAEASDAGGRGRSSRRRAGSALR